MLLNPSNSFNRSAIFARAWRNATKWASTPERRKLILGLWLKDAWRVAREHRAHRLSELERFPAVFAAAAIEGVYPSPKKLMIGRINGSTTEERFRDHERQINNAMAAHRRTVVAMIFGSEFRA